MSRSLPKASAPGEFAPSNSGAKQWESEERFRRTFENAAVGVAHVAPTGSWLRVNRRLCEILDYTVDEFLAKTFQDITHPGDLETDLAHRQRMHADEIDSFGMEKRYLRKDSSIVWARLTVSAARKESRVVDYFICIFEDISENKRAEIELRESEEKFRGIFEYAATGIAITDLRGRFQSCNPAYSAMLGYAADEIRLLDFPNLIHSDDREANMVQIGRLISQAIPSFEIVNRYTGKNGKLTWVHKHISLLRDAQSRPTSIMALVTDITERRRNEELLRESEERLRLALDAAELGTWHWEVAKGPGTVKADARCYALFGRPSSTPASYQIWAEAILPEDRGEAEAAVARALNPADTGDDYACEYRVKHPDGKVLCLSATGRAFFERDPACHSARRPVSIAGTVRDVTAARLAETARREMERRNRYLLELEKQLQEADTAQVAARTACEALSRELGASLAFVGEFQPNTEHMIIANAWSASGHLVPIASQPHLADLGAKPIAELRAGEAVTVTDVADDPRTVRDEAARATYVALGIRSSIGLPLLRNGKLCAILFVADEAPRWWTEAEAGLAKETLDRAWQWLERAQADALRESEQRLRHLGDSLPDSAVYRYAHELDGTPRFYYISAGIEPLIGVRVEDVLRDAGVLQRQILPDYLPQLAGAERRSAAGLSDFKMEIPMRRPGGETRWIRWQSRPQRLPDGRVMWDGVMTDITDRVLAEKALREARKDLDHAQAVARTGSWRLDVSRNKLTMSGELYRIFGQMTAPPTYKNFLAAIHPGDRERVDRSWKAALKGAPYDIECRLVVGAKTTWVHVRAELEFGVGGRLLATFGTVQDITGKRRAEEALRESEERLRLANEAAGIGTFTIDVEAGVASNSPELSAMLGIPGVSTARIEAVFARVHREDLPWVRARYEAALGGTDGGQLKMEFRFVRPGGEIRWITLTGRVDFREGPHGRLPYRVTGACIDATERVRAEEIIRQSEERFRGIFEHAATGIAIMDLDGRFQSCNPAYSAMLGYTEEELRELVCKDLIHSDDRAANKVQHDRLLAGDITSYEIVSRYCSKEGHILWGYRHISLLRHVAFRPTNIVALVTNITERKRHEDQINLLLREVNHRSKNMLSVVQAIARQTVVQNSDDFIERFDERIQALAASQDLLVKNEWNGVDLDELARTQLGHFNDMIGTRIDLRGAPLLISASAAQALGMALHELATNAGKYGALSDEKGRVELHWSVNPGEGEDETFLIGWRERGGPPVSAPTRTGFGSTVLCRVAKESLDAQVELDFAPAGLIWRLRCPAREVLDASRST